MKRGQHENPEGRDWVSILILIAIVGVIGWMRLQSLAITHPPNHHEMLRRAEELAQHRWNLSTNEPNGSQRWLQFIRAGDGEPWELNWPQDHPDYQLIVGLPACSQLTFTAQSEPCRPCPVGSLRRFLGTALPAAELVDYLRVKPIRPPTTKEGAS